MAEKTIQEKEFDKAKSYGGDTRSRMKTIYGKLKNAADARDLDLCKKLMQDLEKEASKLPGIYARMRRALDDFRKAMEAGVVTEAVSVSLPTTLEGFLNESTKEDTTFDGASFSKVKDNSGAVWITRTASQAGGGKAQIESEANTEFIYATFGAGAPVSRVYGDTKLTQAVEGMPLTEYLASSSVSEEAKKQARAQFMEHLDVDCMLANWSCVGGNSKTEFTVVKDGKVYRTGSYAAMSFRVKEGEKSSSNWGGDPTDFFSLWAYDNQKAVLGPEGVSPYRLMKKTLERNWDSVLSRIDPRDAKIIRKRIKNIKTLVEYGEELEREEKLPDIEINSYLKWSLDNKYKKPKVPKVIMSDREYDKFRIPMPCKAKIDKPTDIGMVRIKYKHEDLDDDDAYKVIAQMNDEDGTGAPPIMAQTMEEFLETVGDYVGYRTIKDDPDISLEDQIKDLKDKHFYIACGGGRWHGFGMYVNMCNRKLDANFERAMPESKSYGRHGIQNATFLIGTTKDFKWGVESEIIKKARRSGLYVDTGVMARALGYDGYVDHDLSDYSGTAYAVILNRSKTVIYERYEEWN